jgi:hypothetical protein
VVEVEVPTVPDQSNQTGGRSHSRIILTKESRSQTLLKGLMMTLLHPPQEIHHCILEEPQTEEIPLEEDEAVAKLSLT